MSQDRYTKFMLTIIALSLFFIALNLAAMEFFLYDLYNGGFESFSSKVSSRIDELSARIDEFALRIDQVASSIDRVVEAIKKR